MPTLPSIDRWTMAYTPDDNTIAGHPEDDIPGAAEYRVSPDGVFTLGLVPVRVLERAILLWRAMQVPTLAETMPREWGVPRA